MAPAFDGGGEKILIVHVIRPYRRKACGSAYQFLAYLGDTRMGAVRG